MEEKMSLEQVRDWHRKKAREMDVCGELMFPGPNESPFYRYPSDESKAHDAIADTIDAHLNQPAQAVDMPKGWSAENLERCCRELNGLIKLASDYDFDEMTVATFETSIACILVCLATLPNANGKEDTDAAR